LHGFGATGADGAMERRGVVFVLCVNVGPGLQEDAEGLELLFGIVFGIADGAIGGVVQRRCGTMIMGGVWIGAVSDQNFDEIGAMAGRCEVEGGVSGVKPVEDFGFVEAGFDDLLDGKRWICAEQLFGFWDVVPNYGGEEKFHRSQLNCSTGKLNFKRTVDPRS